ncbi:MAG: hypothetical protein ACP5UM_05560 [Anaerolineae bacterium]
MFSRFRRPLRADSAQEQAQSGPTEPSQEVEQSHMPSSQEEVSFSCWLDQAASLSPSPQPPDWLTSDPVLIVCLGRAGRSIFHSLREYLECRCGENWPDHLRLILLEVLREAPSQVTVPPRTSKFTIHSLVVDREHLRQLQVERLGWFDRERLGNPERALGRLAVYADLQQGLKKSELWSLLSTNIQDLSNLSVYIIADTFSDETSGLVGDLAYLVRTVARPGQVTRVDLFLACQHMDWGDEIGDYARQQRTFATFRELQRLQTRRPKRFDYAPGLEQPTLDREYAEALFDEIYLFDGLAERYAQTGQARDYSDRRPEEAVFPVMTGCLLSLLCHPVREEFYQHAVNRTSIPARVAREAGKGLEYRASAMGSHTVSLPADQFRAIAELRLAHEALFHQDHGLFRWERLPTSQEDQPQTNPWSAEIDPTEVQAFEARLRPKGLSLNPQEFGKRLRDYIASRMNASKPGALQWAKSFLDAVEEHWPAYQEVVHSARRSVKAWLDLAGTIPTTRRPIQPSTQIPSDPFAEFFAPQKTRASGKVEKQVPGPLLQEWRKRWEEANRQFQELGNQPTQYLLLGPKDEPEIYKRYVERLKQWKELQERTRWVWGRVGEDFELRLLVLPLNLEAPAPFGPGKTLRESIRRSPAFFSFGSHQYEEILQRFLELARCYTEPLVDGLRGYRGLDQQKIEEIALATWERASLLVRTRKFAEETRELYAYLMVPKGEVWEKLQKAILARRPVRQGVAPNWNFQTILSPDPFTLRFLQVEHMLLLDTLEPYVQAKERYTPQPRLHVWKEEAQVSRLESQAREFAGQIDQTKAVFSPHLVWFLAHRREETLLFGQCALYSLIEVEVDQRQGTITITKAQDRLLDALGCLPQDLVDSSLYNVLERFSQILSDQAKKDKVKRLLAQTRPSSLRDFLNLKLEDRIQPFLGKDVDSPTVQDLGLLMALLAAEEQDAITGHA